MNKNNDTVSTTTYTIASFFGGVGGIDLGFEKTKKFSTVFINEFDNNAQKTIELNFPHVLLDKRDIRDIPENEVTPADLIVGGFPCQAFSIAGYRKGFEDERGDLFFELLRMIKYHTPRAIFIENVKNMVTHDHGNTFKVIREALTLNGYFIKWKVLNAKDYGNIPQNRERIYIVGFRTKEEYDKFTFPDPVPLTQGLDSVIDFQTAMEEKYYYKQGVQPFYDMLEEAINSQETVYQWRRQYVRENKSGVVPTLTANMGTGGHNVPLILSNNGIRKLTPRETFNVQGFPKKFKLPEISNGQLYKQAGNSVVIPVIERVAVNIANALENAKVAENIYDSKNIIKGQFALIYVKMNSVFEGESYLLSTYDSLEEAQTHAQKSKLPLLSDEDYFKLIKKKGNHEFSFIK